MGRTATMIDTRNVPVGSKNKVNCASAQCPEQEKNQKGMVSVTAPGDWTLTPSSLVVMDYQTERDSSSSLVTLIRETLRESRLTRLQLVFALLIAVQSVGRIC